jgi:hypothetical protein
MQESGNSSGTLSAPKSKAGIIFKFKNRENRKNTGESQKTAKSVPKKYGISSKFEFTQEAQ